MAKFRKLDPRIWRDEKFRLLSPIEKLTALYCLTCQTNRIGIFFFSLGMASEDVGGNVSPNVGGNVSPNVSPNASEGFEKVFEKVIAKLRWRWDSTNRVLFLPNWWKYNPPENLNVMKSLLSDLHELPESPLIQEFVANTRYLSGAVLKTFQEETRERRGERRGERIPLRMGERRGDQEQEQEQEQEENLPIPGSPEPARIEAVSELPEEVSKGPKKVKPAKQQEPPKPKAVRERCPLWDAIVEVTGAESSTNGGLIGKLKKQLENSEHPYSPDEVLEFGRRFPELCPWGPKDGRTRPTITELGKYIGLVRAGPVPGGIVGRRGETTAEIFKRALGNVFDDPLSTGENLENGQ